MSQNFERSSQAYNVLMDYQARLYMEAKQAIRVLSSEARTHPASTRSLITRDGSNSHRRSFITASRTPTMKRPFSGRIWSQGLFRSDSGEPKGEVCRDREQTVTEGKCQKGTGNIRSIMMGTEALGLPKRNYAERNNNSLDTVFKPLPFGVLKGGAVASVSALKEMGVLVCPECQVEWTEDGGNRCFPTQEGCGHVKCTRCLILNDINSCSQCNLVKQKEALSKGQAAPKTTVKSPPSPPPDLHCDILTKKQKAVVPRPADGTTTTTSPCNNSHYFSSLKGLKPPKMSYMSKLPLKAKIKLNGLQPLEPLDKELILSSVVSAAGSHYENGNKNKENGKKGLLLGPGSVVNNKSIESLLGQRLGSQSFMTVELMSSSNTVMGTLKIPKPSAEGGPPFSKKRRGTGPEEEEERAAAPENIRKRKRNPLSVPEHVITVTDDKTGQTELYSCTHCGKKFKTRAHIKYHEFCKSGMDKPFKCEVCSQGFIAKSHFEYHMRTHTGERPYTCPVCGKGFNQQGKVTRHMRSHTGEKPFSCQQCGRSFSNPQALRSHFLIHTGERPYECKYCSKRFTGMTNLKKHEITHTGERPFGCGVCGKHFGLKWTLDLHLRTHSTEKPFGCDECTKAFANSKDLRRHQVIHTGDRPFPCWVCGTRFRRKDNLDRHIRNTHSIDKDSARALTNLSELHERRNNAEKEAKLQSKGARKSISPAKENADEDSDSSPSSSPGSGKACATSPVASPAGSVPLDMTRPSSSGSPTRQQQPGADTNESTPPPRFRTITLDELRHSSSMDPSSPGSPEERNIMSKLEIIMESSPSPDKAFPFHLTALEPAVKTIVIYPPEGEDIQGSTNDQLEAKTRQIPLPPPPPHSSEVPTLRYNHRGSILSIEDSPAESVLEGAEGENKLPIEEHWEFKHFISPETTHDHSSSSSSFNSSSLSNISSIRSSRSSSENEAVAVVPAVIKEEPFTFVYDGNGEGSVLSH